MRHSANIVFQLEKNEKVSCYYCMKQNNYAEYPKGEAFLAGPGHSPLDGNANYICKKHLDEDAIIAED